MSSESISLQVTVWISPENVPKFFEALRPVYEKVIAEPECTFFEYYEDPEEPGRISWVENWYAILSLHYLLLRMTSAIEDYSLIGLNIGLRVKNGYFRYVYRKRHWPTFPLEKEKIEEDGLVTKNNNRTKCQRNIIMSISPSQSQCLSSHGNSRYSGVWEHRLRWWRRRTEDWESDRDITILAVIEMNCYLDEGMGTWLHLKDGNETCMKSTASRTCFNLARGDLSNTSVGMANLFILKDV